MDTVKQIIAVNNLIGATHLEIKTQKKTIKEANRKIRTCKHRLVQLEYKRRKLIDKENKRK